MGFTRKRKQNENVKGNNSESYGQADIDVFSVGKAAASRSSIRSTKINSMPALS